MRVGRRPHGEGAGSPSLRGCLLRLTRLPLLDRPWPELLAGEGDLPRGEHAQPLPLAADYLLKYNIRKSFCWAKKYIVLKEKDPEWA